jgi:hypothetical protein
LNAPLLPHMAEPAAACLNHELELHIEDAQHLYLMAYERFQLHGLPHDRDEAVEHLHRMNAAILARPAVVQMERHAAFERRLDAGLDYFNSQHAQELGKQVGRRAR